MGNVLGKKKRKHSKKKKVEDTPALFSTSNMNYLQVELPKEIVEDLERPRAGPAQGIKDPAREMYEKLKALDQPALTVPKPWSEMDQILSQLKSTAVTPQTHPQRFQSTSTIIKEKNVQEEPAGPAAVIDMGELMDGLDEEARRSVSREKLEEETIDPMEFIKTKPFNPRSVKSLEKTISFTTIHTVKELDGGSSEKTLTPPETVESVLKRRASLTDRPHEMSSPARLSNELSRRSNELNRRSSEIVRRSSEIERRAHEQHRPLSELRRSGDFVNLRQNLFSDAASPVPESQKGLAVSS